MLIGRTATIEDIKKRVKNSIELSCWDIAYTWVGQRLAVKFARVLQGLE